MANPQILFVSEEKIKSFSSINFNVSPQDLLPFIYNAQQIYIQQLLGGSYYLDLQSKISGSTLSAADTYLLDNYIGPILVNYGLYLAMPFLKYRIYNKGVLSGTSENGDIIALSELQWLQEQVKDIAESYAQRMKEYICHRLTSYPLYASPDSADGPLPDKSSQYTSSIYTTRGLSKLETIDSLGYNEPNVE